MEQNELLEKWADYAGQLAVEYDYVFSWEELNKIFALYIEQDPNFLKTMIARLNPKEVKPEGVTGRGCAELRSML